MDCRALIPRQGHRSQGLSGGHGGSQEWGGGGVLRMHQLFLVLQWTLSPLCLRSSAFAPLPFACWALLSCLAFLCPPCATELVWGPPLQPPPSSLPAPPHTHPQQPRQSTGNRPVRIILFVLQRVEIDGHGLGLDSRGHLQFQHPAVEQCTTGHPTPIPTQTTPGRAQRMLSGSKCWCLGTKSDPKNV